MYKYNIGTRVALDNENKAFLTIKDRRMTDEGPEYKFFNGRWINEKELKTKENFLEIYAKFSVGDTVIIADSLRERYPSELRIKDMIGKSYCIQKASISINGSVVYKVEGTWVPERDLIENVIKIEEITNEEVLSILGENNG